VEVAGGDREFAVLVRHLDPLGERDHELLAAFAAATGIRVFLQPGGYDTVAPLHDGTPRHLDYLNPELGLRFRFLPTDFIQVNPYVNRMLVRNALLAMGPLDGRVAVDLFCGIGNFSLALARTGARVYGYEHAATAVQQAVDNAADNGLSGRAEFAVADLYDSRCASLPEADVMLLDPPRSGAGINLERWVASPRLQRIAYVSCSPQSFASDAARLQAAGYVLKEAGIFDMFPHTAHVETLGLFQRRPDSSRG
jgi:23S rRNA (uracil1939-C5)-methyltransferase